MGEMIKELFKGISKQVKTPQVAGLAMILLLAYRLLLPGEFTITKTLLVNGLGKFSFLINLIQVSAVLLLFASVAVFIMAIIYTIIYCILDTISEKRKESSEKLDDALDTYHRFFLGSKSAFVGVSMWLLVFVGYFYLADETNFTRYQTIILSFCNNTNMFIKILLMFYGFAIISSALSLIKGIFYRFLYFRTREEKQA